MADITNYRAFMESYVQFLEEMAQSEAEKYAAMLSYDPKKIDQTVSRQQAMNMRLAQLEEQRAQEQRRAGFGDKTFQQILQELQGQDQEVFSQLFRRFEKAIMNVKYFNGKTVSFVQDGLRMIGATGQGESGTYRSDGKRPADAPGASLFEAKV